MAAPDRPQDAEVSVIFTACSSFPQFLPIYVNPRNDKLQAFYRASLEERTRDEFLRLLQQNSTSIVLD